MTVSSLWSVTSKNVKKYLEKYMKFLKNFQKITYLNIPMFLGSREVFPNLKKKVELFFFIDRFLSIKTQI